MEDPESGSDDTHVAEVIPVGFNHNGATFALFLHGHHAVGTPQTVAAQELRIECLFPVDESTEALHLESMSRSA